MPLGNPSSKLQFFHFCIQAVVPVFYRGCGFFCFLCLLFLCAAPLAAETSYEADIRKAAQAGDGESQYALALLHEYGGETVHRNPELAVHWLEKAGQKKVAGACLYLGLKYENGNGVKQDYARALCWYLCAAKQDWPMAQFFLAGFYEQGKGVDASPFTALAWLGLAREHGYPKAGDEFSRLQKETGSNDSRALVLLQGELMRGPVTPCN